MYDTKIQAFGTVQYCKFYFEGYDVCIVYAREGIRVDNKRARLEACMQYNIH